MASKVAPRLRHQCLQTLLRRIVSCYGDRGGDYQDEEFIKDLRAISSKSASDRFASEDDEAAEESLPPWNRRSECRKPMDDNVVVTTAKDEDSDVVEDTPKDKIWIPRGLPSRCKATEGLKLMTRSYCSRRYEPFLPTLQSICYQHGVGGNPLFLSISPEENAFLDTSRTETTTAMTLPNGTTSPLRPWKRKSTRPKQKTTSDYVVLVARQPRQRLLRF